MVSLPCKHAKMEEELVVIEVPSKQPKAVVKAK